MKESAVTQYPNILAEIEASGMYLWCPAEHAGVSQEIMAAVLEDGEELTFRELMGLVWLYGCEVAYLISPELSMVDPATNSGKAQRRMLADLMRQVDVADGLDYLQQLKVEYVLTVLDSGKPVTYAAYRRAVDKLQNAIGGSKRIQPRNTRLA